jgi:hypothetical protein
MKLKIECMCGCGYTTIQLMEEITSSIVCRMNKYCLYCGKVTKAGMPCIYCEESE